MLRNGLSFAQVQRNGPGAGLGPPKPNVRGIGAMYLKTLTADNQLGAGRKVCYCDGMVNLRPIEDRNSVPSEVCRLRTA